MKFAVQSPLTDVKNGKRLTVVVVRFKSLDFPVWTKTGDRAAGAIRCKMSDGALRWSSADSVCHPLDDFNVTKGCKIAFERALNNLTSNRVERARFWEVFFKYFPSAKDR